jgi:hypothetical protein
VRPRSGPSITAASNRSVSFRRYIAPPVSSRLSLTAKRPSYPDIEHQILNAKMVAVPLLNVATLVAALNQTQTNGNSTLGTSNAPQLGDFLSSNNNTVPFSSLIASTPPPWGSKTVDNSNQYTDTPDTGDCPRASHIMELQLIGFCSMWSQESPDITISPSTMQNSLLTELRRL